MSKTFRSKYAKGLRVELRNAEKHAVVLRKLLAQLRQRQLASGGEKMGDALRLVNLIEQIARHGQVCSAADAVEIVGLIEELTSKLADDVDDILAF